MIEAWAKDENLKNLENSPGGPVGLQGPQIGQGQYPVRVTRGAKSFFFNGQ